ncbi:MAG TPA: DUF6677 family protein, partial [Vicinamibacterales bacterium]|nr:DUF6677 family protein [Vicinamibacterales bacterium]
PPFTRPGTALTVALAWLFPGAGHFLQGQSGKALVFGAALLPMYVCGLAMGGRLFAFQGGEPLVLLAAASQWMIGATRLVAGWAGSGAGDVVAASYEYGNTFLIVSGLLNVLVMFDAADVARGRKVAPPGQAPSEAAP